MEEFICEKALICGITGQDGSYLAGCQKSSSSKAAAGLAGWGPGASVQAWPEVVECAALTGEMDYLLRVVVQDMAHYSRFIMDTLLKHPSVQDCKTSFVLDRVKATTAVPV